jgi:diguanylate cyclase (GGDEF)-like protein
VSHNRVLVADRNTTFLEKTAEILVGAGIEMIPATNGTRVLTFCRQERPEVALLHVDLAGMPGTEVCHRLKTQLDPTLPVVLMFAEESTSIPEITKRCLADNYLVRPLKRAELLFCVRAALQLRSLLQERAAAVLLTGKDAAGRTSGMVSLDIFHSFLALEIRRVDRYGFPLALIDIHVDPLPEADSTWTGALDSQLGPALSEAMRACLRDIDLTTVISHREMLGLMPHTDKEGSTIAAERIRTTVSAQSYHFGRAHIQPTVSVGVACLHGEGVTPDEFIARAKANRVQSAEAGGNRVTVA